MNQQRQDQLDILKEELAEVIREWMERNRTRLDMPVTERNVMWVVGGIFRTLGDITLYGDSKGIKTDDPGTVDDVQKVAPYSY